MKLITLATTGILVAWVVAAPLGGSPQEQPAQAKKDKVEYANERAMFQGNTGGVHCISFSPDGKLLAVACNGPNEGIKIWDVAKVECVKTLDGFRSLVKCVAFSPDGKTLAVTGPYIPVRLYDVATWEPQRSFGDPKTTTVCVAFSPDGKTLAVTDKVTDKDRHVIFWDVAKREKRSEAKADFMWPLQLCFSKNGKYLAIGDYGKAFVWDVANDKLLWKLEGHERLVQSLAFSPDSKLLVTVEYNLSAKSNALIWDVETGKRVTDLDIRKRYYHIGAAAFSPDGKTLAVVGDLTVTLWRPVSGECIGQMKAVATNAAVFTCVAFSPDGQMIAAGSNGGVVSLFDMPKD